MSNPILRAEFQKSKLTYCDLAEGHDGHFDLIVEGDLPEPVEGMVVRKMTREHIPADFTGEIIFPPFTHWQARGGEWVRVAASHHHKGAFCTTHGRITNALAKAILLLAQRYSNRANFSGYSYRDEMEASAILSLMIAALKFNEARSDNPFAYYTMVAKNAMISVLNKERRVRDIRDEVLWFEGAATSYSHQLR